MMRSLFHATRTLGAHPGRWPSRRMRWTGPCPLALGSDLDRTSQIAQLHNHATG
jgi:hypothetical protein